MSKPRTGAPKRVAVGLLAGAVSLFGIALAPPAGATPTVTNERFGGTNRYDTARLIAADEAFAAPTHVIIATGQNYPDALAASTLAGANGNAPIILTASSALSTEASSALDAIKTKGVVSAFVVGGTTAVSTAVEDAVKGKGFTVTRIGGTNRYETAGLIAAAADVRQDSGSVGGLKTALIATGTNFPDALAGGPAATRSDLPLLIVDSTVPDATKKAITDLGIKKAIILGGTTAVSEAVATELQTLTGNAPTRLGGTNRYGTAALVGDYEIGTLAFPAGSAILATGLNFPDALASGPLGGQLGAPIVLTASLPPESQAFLAKHNDKISKLYVSGGTSAIDAATLTSATTASQTASNASSTDAPELVSVQFVAQASTSVATYRFTFDEAITGATPTATLFKLYDNSVTAIPGTAGQAQIDSTNTSSVVVAFPVTAEARANLTVATVAFGAVTDVASKVNPEGDFALSSVSAAAGATSGPDLVSVGNFRANASGDGVLVDYTFDEATSLVSTGAAALRLITASNTEFTTAGDPVAGSLPVTDVFGQGTTVLTGNFAGGNTTLLSNLTVARGLVDDGTVKDATGVLNARQTADVNGTGNTSGPDLVSVTFNTEATNGALLPVDQATYVFDEPVSTTVTQSAFCFYTVAGGASTCGATAATRSATADTSVVVTFADGALSNAVGANVDDNAVTGATGAAGRANQEDEVAVQGISFTAGRTSGPDLTGARLVTATTDPFSGAVTNYSVVYTFDEAISAASINPALFKVFTGTTAAVGAAYVTGATAGCGVVRSTTNTAEAVLTCAGQLSPSAGFVNGGFTLATVATAAATDGTTVNPEGASTITQPS